MKNEHLIGARISYRGEIANVIAVSADDLTCHVEYERTKALEVWFVGHVKQLCKVVSPRTERVMIALGKANGHNADDYWTIVQSDGLKNGTERWLDPIVQEVAA